MYESLLWTFGPSGSEDHGPKDSITTTFKGNKYYSLAREVIQNSLDAVLDETKPVKVEFSLFELHRDELPNLFDLKCTVRLCRENFPNVPAFVKFCNAAEDVLSEESITCLRIGDFNTKGLEYGEGKTAFYAFMKAVGFTQKSTSGSGGSFGFGKGAYYAASVLRTLIISSVYGETTDDFVFQGKARLTTHLDSDGVKKDYTGLFGGDDIEPILDPTLVPEFLRRTVRGTDVILVGFDDNEQTWRDHLIRSVINNFWLAILDGKLVVEVEGTTIEKENIERLAETFFHPLDDGKLNDPETWSPLPYIKAVKYKESPNNRFFEKTLPTLGKVQLFLYLHENLQNRTVFMRRPKMTVFKKTRNRSVNYAGVFVCDDDNGNEILREMENPEHNEWRKTNYLDGETPHRSATAAENEYKAFVTDCLDELQSDKFGSRRQILGLDEYLSIPEDLLPDQDGEGNEGSDGSNDQEETGETETAVEGTAIKEEPAKMKITVRKPVVPQPATGEPGEGDEKIFTGGQHGGDGDGGTKEPGPNPGGEASTGNVQGTNPIKKPLRLRQRVVAQKTPEGRIVHIVKLFSESQAIADVEFLAGVDNDTGGDDSLVIRAASKNDLPLAFRDNTLSDVWIDSGENVLRIEFDSDQKHALRVRSYEV